MQAFIEHLSAKNLSNISLKNYKSDLQHFKSWVILKLRTIGTYADTFEECVSYLDSQVIKNYLDYLLENNTPIKTVNRRLTTLRNLSKFLVKTSYLDNDFMSNISNIKAVNNIANNPSQTIIDDYKTFLIAEKVSANTIKNYISDARQFLNWLNNNPTYAQSN